MTASIVHCRAVSYRYPGQLTALSGVDWAIQEGDLVLLAGASGSGKSTLCRLLRGLIPHLHGGELTGDLLVAGHSIGSMPPHVMSSSVGLLLQRAEAQVVATTVARDIASGLAAHGLHRVTIEERVREVARLLDLTHLLQRAPHTLSGGELQRVALAGVLALQPRVLVLDEPFAFLDAPAAARLRTILSELHRQGITLVVAEHRLDQVAAIATRMVILHAGRIVADAAPRAVLKHDLSRWGLERPPLVQLASAAHLDAVPLTLEEAVEAGVAPPPVQAAVAAGPSPPIVEWDDVWFKRDNAAILRGLNLTSTAGTTVALLGANGAGKTTVLHHANGLLRPQRGIVRVMRRAVGRRPVAELARDVGLVAQQPSRMLVAPTVREELALGPRSLRRNDSAWSSTIIERFQLAALLDRVPQRLSAGEQRRVALAAILVGRPRALMLDEPTVGQDATGRRALHAQIAACADEGIAVLLATHDTEWAFAISARWAVLIDGQIMADDQPSVVCNDPQLMDRARLALPTVEALRQKMAMAEVRRA
ncbi:MAG: ABC transporter [Chloroflexi bacterium]|nr:MAG: ABC transporter [Chloroflexota bacterium]